MSIEALEKAIQIAGSQAELARRIKKKQGHVWAWLHRDKCVPAELVLAIELATEGKVMRHELRPDLYPVPVPLAVAVVQEVAKTERRLELQEDLGNLRQKKAMGVPLSD